MSRLDKKGQSTTEMAILATILLLAFAGMLKWGQTMNKQQEAAMLCFRKAMQKAYEDYDGGDGYGGASYSMTNFTRTVEPFNKYYTASQRQRVGAHSAILWDPDLLYCTEDDGPKTYYNVDGVERDLGQRPEIWNTATDIVTQTEGLTLEKMTGAGGAQDYVKASIKETRKMAVMKENGSEVVITSEETYNKDERWITPWE